MTTVETFRLPDSVWPVKYNLTLTPDLENFTFDGEEAIELEVRAKTNSVKINSAELQITHAEIDLGQGKILEAIEISHNEERETATLTFAEDIPTGSCILNLAFTGILNDQLRGFYRSQYTGPDGQIMHMATTQFEATDARRAFPCWDDPSTKAIFQVNLIVPSDLQAISNTMPFEDTNIENGKKLVRFEESPKMSTYLLAFIVGDIACVEANAANNTLIRVWATRGKEKQGQYALENAVKLLEYFNDYFGIPYPLSKLDHIAIPDFAAGAMENWGAITYRETALLHDPDNSSAGTRQRILEVVSHEMAHMWFGDLVTMEWWDDLWLNESFASWMGDKAVDQLYPEWHMWTQFVANDTNRGLSLDGLRNSHPIEAEVKDPAQIRELFDAISYSKGGATLRMLEEFLGQEIFRQGLNSYLSAHQYSNARTEDLWKALEEASGLPVTDIMNTWIKQTGYPVLDVNNIQDSGNTIVNIQQNRFLYDHLLVGNQEDPELWKVPIGITTKDKVEPTSLLLADRSASITLSDVTNSDWIKINAGQTGFYRVNYSEADWNKLKLGIEKMELSPTDRLGLQNDSYALMRAGFTPAIQFLSLVEAYKNDDDATVWNDLAINLRGLESILLDEDFLSQYQASVRNLYSDISGKVGWVAKPDEGHLDSLLRSTVLLQSGAFGNQQVIDQAKIKFDMYLKNPNSLHPDLRGVVYSLSAQYGDDATYETLWNLERSTTLHEEKMRFLGSLSRFQQEPLLSDLLKRSLSEDIRSQDTVLVIGAVAGNPKGRNLAWEFVKSNWSEFDRRYGKGGFALMNLVSITGAFTTADRLKDVEDFFENHKAPSAERTIQQSLERIKLNITWLENNRQSIKEWMSSKH